MMTAFGVTLSSTSVAPHENHPDAEFLFEMQIGLDWESASSIGAVRRDLIRTIII
jgi:hypothetical protein